MVQIHVEQVVEHLRAEMRRALEYEVSLSDQTQMCIFHVWKDGFGRGRAIVQGTAGYRTVL